MNKFFIIWIGLSFCVGGLGWCYGFLTLLLNRSIQSFLIGLDIEGGALASAILGGMFWGLTTIIKHPHFLDDL